MAFFATKYVIFVTQKKISHLLDKNTAKGV